MAKKRMADWVAAEPPPPRDVIVAKNAAKRKRVMDDHIADLAAKPNGCITAYGTATQTIYCGDNLEKLKTLPDECVDLIYIDPPFNSNRDYEVFWGEAKEKRAFDDRHESAEAYIEFMRPRCIELHRVLKRTGSFYYHCDWHADSYVRRMLSSWT